MAVNKQVLELREGTDYNLLQYQSQTWLQRRCMIPSVRWLHWKFKIFPCIFFFLFWPSRPLYPLLEEGKWHKTTWIQVFPHPQRSSYAARSLCRAEQSHGHGFVLSRVIQLPLTQFFPCSSSHSSLTNKAELSTERGGGGAARWLCKADDHISLPVFCSFCFFLRLSSLFSWFTFKSFSTSLFIPGSHCTPVIWEASQGRCLWHLLQHMVHLLLRGALRVPASCSSVCACGRARGGCQLCSRPPKQGPFLMQFAFNTVKYISSGWLTIYFLSKWSPADRIFINFSGQYDRHSWKLMFSASGCCPHLSHCDTEPWTASACNQGDAPQKHRLCTVPFPLHSSSSTVMFINIGPLEVFLNSVIIMSLVSPFFWTACFHMWRTRIRSVN